MTSEPKLPASGATPGCSGSSPSVQGSTAAPCQSPEPGAAAALHPSKSARQRRLVRRINNFFVYRTIRRAIRDCGIRGAVLVAPCGYGWFFDRFRRDGIEIVGVDILPRVIVHAQMAVSPPMQVLQADIQQLPFADGQFEFILSNRFVLHFEDGFRARALREFARVTRRYLLVHYDTTSLHQFMRRLRGFHKPDLSLDKLQGWRKNKRKSRRLFYDREQMAAEGAGAGFTIKRLYPVFYLLSDRVYCLYEKTGAP